MVCYESNWGCEPHKPSHISLRGAASELVCVGLHYLAVHVCWVPWSDELTNLGFSFERHWWYWKTKQAAGVKDPCWIRLLIKTIVLLSVWQYSNTLDGEGDTVPARQALCETALLKALLTSLAGNCCCCSHWWEWHKNWCPRGAMSWEMCLYPSPIQSPLSCSTIWITNLLSLCGWNNLSVQHRSTERSSSFPSSALRERRCVCVCCFFPELSAASCLRRNHLILLDEVHPWQERENCVCHKPLTLRWILPELQMLPCDGSVYRLNVRVFWSLRAGG